MIPFDFDDQMTIARSHAEDLRGLVGKGPVDFPSILECFSNDDHLDVFILYPAKGIKEVQEFAGRFPKMGKGRWKVKDVKISEANIPAISVTHYPSINIMLEAVVEKDRVEEKKTTMAAADFQDKLDDVGDDLEDCRADIESLMNMWDGESMSTEQKNTLSHYVRVLEDLQADLENDKEANAAAMEEEAAEDVEGSE